MIVAYYFLSLLNFRFHTPYTPFKSTVPLAFFLARGTSLMCDVLNTPTLEIEMVIINLHVYHVKDL